MRSVPLLILLSLSLTGNAAVGVLLLRGGEPTRVEHFTPPVEGLDIEGHGSCWIGSTSISEGWRCSVGDELFDPCYLGADGETVVCGASPVGPQSPFALIPTEPLPPLDPPPAAGSVEANVLVLDDGTTCRWRSGASLSAEGERINYACMRGGEEEPTLGIAGEPELVRGLTWTERWIVRVGRFGSNGRGVELLTDEEVVAVRSAWR